MRRLEKGYRPAQRIVRVMARVAAARVAAARAAAALAACAFAVCAVGASAPAAGAATTSYVDVSVATVWASPSSPRPIDRPALGDPVDLQAWGRALTTAARLGLVGRTETQALLGEPVKVLARRGAWTRVAVTDQPTPLNHDGYPGWVPTLQLTSNAAFGDRLRGPVAVVTWPTARLEGELGVLQVSFGTRLPVLGVSAADVIVTTPAGAVGRLPAAAVRIYRWGTGTTRARVTGAQLVRTARTFLGVRYLWGGTSAFGFDCSGLVSLIYRAWGVAIPRDAAPQAAAGRFVLRRALRPGDLVFFATDPPSPAVTHVAMYVGGGRILDAPDSAGAVHVIPLAALGSEYVTARRYLPAQ